MTTTRSLLALLAGVACAVACTRVPEARAAGHLWIEPARLMSLPSEGPAWESLLRAAQLPTDTPNLSDGGDPTNVRVLAKALVYARTGEERYRQEVISACWAAMGTEAGGTALTLGRELAAYVIAADLIGGLPGMLDHMFRGWLGGVRHRDLSGRTLVSTHERRPNNWGTHAGASRAAVAAYLGDAEDLERTARVFRGWLGDRSSYSGFVFRELWWQADPSAPVGINALGATRDGYSIDGVLPDDQRRGGPFQWPPPKVNYAYGALQGALAQAIILHNAGYDVWEWQDRALLRAFRWLHLQSHYPAGGDDTWQPHVINYYYPARFPAPLPAEPGKNVGWTDWTHRAAARLAEPATILPARGLAETIAPLPGRSVARIPAGFPR
jgi:hypothetical protein